jgi:hypothetical protein
VVVVSGSFAALDLDMLAFPPQSKLPPRFPPDIPFASFLSTIFRCPVHQTLPKDFNPHHDPIAAISGPLIHSSTRRQEHVAFAKRASRLAKMPIVGAWHEGKESQRVV